MLLILALIALAVAWAWWTYPRVGGLLFDLITAIEARLSRLTQIPVSIDSMTLATFQGGTPGNTAPLLLIHGFSADKNLWIRFARGFVADHQVIIPDLAGHGKSGFKAGGDYSIAAQAKRMVEMLDACGIDQVHAVGSSMGAYVATWLAAHYPQRVLSLALMGPVGVNLPQPNEVEELVKQGRNPFLIRSRAEFDRFFAMTMASPPWIPGVLLASEAQLYMDRRSELAEIFDDFHDSPRMEPWLGHIQVPTLLLWGREDRMVPLASAQTWIAGIPHARLECWDGVGHLPMVERTEQTVAQYRQFLGEARSV
ncbi:alpha/beta fold hydrolase [Pseudomonas gingeri]|uniref:alpha/beta fold hydrolase n=1 Tax=Pseudomonas gingeri TaxID=117681 RepID=UPI0015A1AE94|nr:alpha/beta fold hydrolase [Pseudomonas gingeri]NVZ24727.1 alpha/beta fold hydrolase [Pseudomonas gingeri]NWE70362.1 alpha/beta fold hydrolase [Pseudomonas gingeri]